MLSTTLKPTGLEKQFRQDALKNDINQLTLAILLAFIPIAAFIINDILTFYDSEYFTEIIFGRILMTIGSIVNLYYQENPKRGNI